jgi:CBS domain-containing protein
MTQNPRTISTDAPLADAIGAMNDHKIMSLFVVKEGGQPASLTRTICCSTAPASPYRRVASTTSAMASALVSPGLSMPNRFTSPAIP